MKLFKILSFLALIVSGHVHAYSSESGLKIASMRNLGDRIHIIFDKVGVCQTAVYSLLLTDSDAQTIRRREALLSNLMLAAASKNNVMLEIWADCPASAEEAWGMSFELLGVTVEF